jgi:hypothetical protein
MHRRCRLATAIAAGVAVVVMAAAGTMVYLLAGDDGQKGAAPRASVSVHHAPASASASASAEPSTPSPSPSPSVRAAPQDYRFQTTDAFRLVAPDGWQLEQTRTAKGPVYAFRSPDEPGWVLQVWPVSEQVSEPADVVDLAENGDGALNRLRDYHRHGPVTQGPGYAELDYSYTGNEHGSLRALYRALRTPDGALWTILVSGPTNAWPRQQQIQHTTLTYFCLTDHCDYEPGS